MQSVIILAAGSGSKLFPYDLTHSKATLKIANLPLLAWNITALRRHTDARIIIVANERFYGDICSCLETYENILVLPMKESAGTAESLLHGIENSSSDCFTVLFGDTIIQEEDLADLLNIEEQAVLMYPMQETPRNRIGGTVESGYLTGISAHSRHLESGYDFAAFRFDSSMLPFLRRTPDFFPDMRSGIGAPHEKYIEAALISFLRHAKMRVIIGKGYFYDIDKPWHMLDANAGMIDYLCAQLHESILGEGSYISEGAHIYGNVKLGKNCYIGDNVLIEGNLIAGDNTVIDNGAVITGNCTVGSNTSIKNYCRIYAHSSIGDHCVIDHCAEFLGGIIMDHTKLCHYCELYGVIGRSTDIGAATVCGTLRFDDRPQTHIIKGRREEAESDFSCAVFIGDYCRTGVGAILMPGSKVGSYSIIGPGVIHKGDTDHGTMISLEQQHSVTKWGPEKYGW